MHLVWLAAAAFLLTAEAEKGGLEVWASDVHVALGEKWDTASVMSRTRVPSACFEAAGTEAKPPAGERIVEHYAPLQLLVRSNPAKNCKESPTFVEHRHQDLDLRGKVGMILWVVADGKVMASWTRVWRKK